MNCAKATASRLAAAERRLNVTMLLEYPGSSSARRSYLCHRHRPRELNLLCC